MPEEHTIKSAWANRLAGVSDTYEAMCPDDQLWVLGGAVAAFFEEFEKKCKTWEAEQEAAGLRSPQHR